MAKNYHKVMLCLPSVITIKRQIMLLCGNLHYAHFDYMVDEVSTRCLHCEVTIFIH